MLVTWLPTIAAAPRAVPRSTLDWVAVTVTQPSRRRVCRTFMHRRAFGRPSSSAALRYVVPLKLQGRVPVWLEPAGLPTTTRGLDRAGWGARVRRPSPPRRWQSVIGDPLAVARRAADGRGYSKAMGRGGLGWGPVAGACPLSSGRSCSRLVVMTSFAGSARRPRAGQRPGAVRAQSWCRPSADRPAPWPGRYGPRPGPTAANRPRHASDGLSQSH